MSDNRIDLLTPVGRLVQGSLYEGSDTDLENRPRVYKTGSNAGQPRTEYFFALAIPKGNEQHWNQTEWGKKIWDVGVKAFPNGQWQSPTFAWKVKDGDSTIPNKKGRIPKDIEGFAGHWVIYFSSSFAPSIYNRDGSQAITQKDYVNPGDYIEVYGYVTDNGSAQQPGVFINHSMVAFAGYGDRIILGADPKAVGFGQSPLPAGASKTPIESFTPPVATANANTPMPASTLPPPHPDILTPPVPAPAPVRTMTPKANGMTYEQFTAAGWNETQLIQHGYMTA